VSAFAEYQNGVELALTGPDVTLRTSNGDAFVGIAINFEAFVVRFVVAVYEASKPLAAISPDVPLGIAKPHVLFASAAAEPQVIFPDAAMLFAPNTMVFVAAFVLTLRS